MANSKRNTKGTFEKIDLEDIKRMLPEEVEIVESTYRGKKQKAVFIDRDFGEFEVRVDRILLNLTRHPKRTKQLGLRKGFLVPIEQTQQIRQKIKETNLRKYGVEHTLQSEEVRLKGQETTLLKYGVRHPAQAREVQEKIRASFADKEYCSKAELEIKTWIRDTFNLDARKSFCGGPRPFEVDIYIPEKNLAIEYNGCYWHSDSVSGNRTNHLFKTRIVRSQKSAQLIHIFECDWIHSKEAIKSFLTGKLGNLEKIRASKCELRQISCKEADALFDKHIQKRPPKNTSSCLGLFYQNELVSVASFSRPHRQTMDPRMNLSRFITKDGFRIMGGLSKICKEAYRLYGEFVSFVDLSISDGASYEKAGFTLESILRPDYFYFNASDKRRVSKQSRKKKLMKTPENMTELQHATQDRLFRVWDCGKKKYKFCL